MIDPCLPIRGPDAVHLSGGRNLTLECKSGSISVDLWFVGEDSDGSDTVTLVDTSGEEKSIVRRRAEMDICSLNGSVNVKLVSITDTLFLAENVTLTCSMQPTRDPLQ